MRTSEIAETYARSLYDLADLSDAVDAADEGFEAIVSAVRGSAELREVLTDTAIPAAKKRDIMREIFAGKVAPEAVAIASAVVDRGKVELLGDVSRAFKAIAERERGLVVAEVTTAVELTDELRATVTEKLTSAMARPVTLRERVDASILGGIVIKVAGRVLDGSLSSQLAAMRTVLSAAPQGGES